MIKRFFTLIALLMLAMAWTSTSARWVVGERKAANQIKAGDTVVIKCAQAPAYEDYFLQAADVDHEELGVIVAPGMGLGASAIITIEDGPLDIRTGAPTVLLKLVGSNKYVGAKYYDWYDKGQTAVDTPEKAGNFQILSCGEEIPWYTTEGTNAEFTYWTRAEGATWDEKSVGFAASPKETDFCYLAYWSYASSSPRAITWKYTNSIQWNVYSVTYEKDVREDLEKLINSYSTASSEFQGGTNPGFYDQTIVDAYNEVLERALGVCYNSASTDEQLLSIYKELQDAYKAMSTSLIPLTEGYYYIVCDNEKIAAQGKAEKAMYINDAVGQVYWGEFNADDSKFLFHITPYDNTQWNVQNLMTEYYLGVPTGFCKPFGVSTDKETPSTFHFYPGTGSCYIKSIKVDGTSWTMCPHGNPQGNNDGPNDVWSYNGEGTAGGNVPHHEWTWQLRKVTDQAVIDRFFNEKSQYDRTMRLKELTQEASALYGKLFVYDVNPDNGLITSADEQVKFSHIRVQGVSFADKYEFLIDNVDSTYVQGSGYIDIAIDKTPTSILTIAYRRRGATVKYPLAQEWGDQERPAHINVYATNDTVNGGEWTKITDVNMADIEDPIRTTIDLGAEYKFVRLEVLNNKSGGNYFTIAELQLYAPTINEANSQYYTEDGMKLAADALMSLIESQREAIANNTVTLDDIKQMEDAYAAVKNRYSDVTILQTLIKECEELAENATVGEEVGQVDDEDQIMNLLLAAADATTVAHKANLSKAELDAAIKSLTAAKNEFMAHVKSFEAGKWYFIVNNDATASTAVGGKALYASGCENTSAISVGLVNEDGSPAYTYDPYAMWTFVPNEGGTYTIQNMGTGYYLGDFVKKSDNIKLSYKPVEYKISFIGAGSYGLVPQSDANVARYGVAANDEGKTQFDVAAAETASSWQIIEIDPEETQFITIKEFMYNSQDVIALPFNLDNLSEFNEDVHIYGIRKITQDAEGLSTIEFYEKESAQAGEACWVVFGNPDPEVDYESYELLIPFPTSFSNKGINTNGLYGMLHPENIAEGDVFSNGKEPLVAEGNNVTISSHTGAILPKLYTGEVVGKQTAHTITVEGMGPINTGMPADVNGDGVVNSADVVAVYSYTEKGDASGFTLDAADVNGDGTVNAADVVAIYTAIAGDSAKSRTFERVAKRLME